MNSPNPASGSNCSDLKVLTATNSLAPVHYTSRSSIARHSKARPSRPCPQTRGRSMVEETLVLWVYHFPQCALKSCAFLSSKVNYYNFFAPPKEADYLSFSGEPHSRCFHMILPLYLYSDRPLVLSHSLLLDASPTKALPLSSTVQILPVL